MVWSRSGPCSSMGARTQGLAPQVSQAAQAIGRSRGGLTRKLLMVTDRAGRWVRFRLLCGNAAEVSALPTLREDIPTLEVEACLAAKGYDSQALRALLAACGLVATIPSRASRQNPPPNDTVSYQARHVVANVFARLKHYRGLATRYCKRVWIFVSFLNLMAWFLGTRAACPV